MSQAKHWEHRFAVITIRDPEVTTRMTGLFSSGGWLYYLEIYVLMCSDQDAGVNANAKIYCPAAVRIHRCSFSRIYGSEVKAGEVVVIVMKDRRAVRYEEMLSRPVRSWVWDWEIK